MIDISTIFTVLTDAFRTLFVESRDVVEKEKADDKSVEFFEKSTVKNSLLFMGVGYVGGALFAIAAEASKMALASSPHQMALLATICPPILSTVVYTVGTTYQLVKLVRLALETNPYDKDSPKGVEWAANRRLNMQTTALTLVACVGFLAASLVPIPGASNALGITILSALLTADLVKFAVKRVNARVANRAQAILDQNQALLFMPTVHAPSQALIHTNNEQHQNNLRSSFGEKAPSVNNSIPMHSAPGQGGLTAHQADQLAIDVTPQVARSSKPYQ